jgi:hypothetical protein
MTVRRSQFLLVPLVVLALGACGVDSDDDDDGDDGEARQPATVAQSVPASTSNDQAREDQTAGDQTEGDLTEGSQTPELVGGMTWQWQLQGEINTSYEADVYDIDLFDAASSTIAELQADNRILICYFSAGSYEEWRDDASEFAEADLGEPLDGWEGERWVDVRTESVRSLMERRLDLAVERGCDGVEPDNVTAHNNETGFEISGADQLSFNSFLATSSHERGLLVGLKNDLEQIPDLASQFDFAVNEECLEYDECEAYGPFVDADKPVFSAEYSDAAVEDLGATCAIASEAGLTTLILPLDLDDSFRISCQDQP